MCEMVRQKYGLDLKFSEGQTDQGTGIFPTCGVPLL